nr:hypothetical protein [Tanacetum cinerariifolium]
MLALGGGEAFLHMSLKPLLMPVAPPSPDYVTGPEHPPSPDNVLGPEHPPSPVYLPEPEYPKYLVPLEDEAHIEDHPLPSDASLVALSPNYVADSDPEEDPKEDPEEDHADYPTDGGDGNDEPSNDDDDDDDDTDDEDEEDQDDDEEEEEPLAPADSFVVPIMDPVLPAGDTEAFRIDEPAPIPGSPQTNIPLSQTRLLHVPSPPLPLPSPLTTSLTNAGAPLGYREPRIRMRALLPSTSYMTDIPEADMPPRKRACLTIPAPRFKVIKVEPTGYGITDTWDEIVETLMEIAPTTLEEDAQDDRALLKARVNTLFRDRPNHRRTSMLLDREVMYAREAWISFEYRSAAIEAHKMAPKKRTTRATPATTNIPTTSVTDAQLWALIDRGVAAALAERDADRSRNGDNSHDSGTGITLMWWNSHVRAVGQDVAYAMPWTALKRMITDKYCPRGEIKKLETEYWNLKVKGVDLLSYNHCFQELALMYDRMFPEESAKEAIEFATEMMDKKMPTHAERQADNKRKFEDTSRNNQNQQQSFKKNNVGLTLQGLEVRSLMEGLNPYVQSAIITTNDHVLKGYYKSDCPKLKSGNQGNRAGIRNVVARAYVVGTTETNPNSNVVTVDHDYDVELADGRIIWVNTLMRGYTLNFLNHPFNIDLMPVEMGSLDVNIGMDLLSKYYAVIVCDEKLVRVPFNNEVLIFHGDGSNNGHEARLNIITCTTTQKYLLKGCPIFLAHATTKEAKDKSKEKRLEDVLIVQDFPEVFPKDFLGIPPTSQVEFQIDLVPGAAPVARAPYRLAPSMMKEFSDCFGVNAAKYFKEKHVKCLMLLVKDLKMRIEQYFLMTDYSLWEVILNGDSLTPTRVVKGVLQHVVPTTTEQSTTEPVSAATSVSAVCVKMHVSSLPNVDSLSNVVIYSFFASQSNSPQLENDDLKQIDADDLKEIDLKWKMATLTVRARRFLQRTGRNLGVNGPTSMGFDMSKMECYNCHRKGHFARECRSPKDSRRNGAAEPLWRNVSVETSTSNALVSQGDGVGSYDWSFQAEEDHASYALMAFSSSSSSSDNELRDNALISLRQTLEKVKQERDDLKLKLEKFQTSSKNLTELLASQTNNKTGLGYNSQVFTRSMFDCDDYLSSESDESWPPSSLYDRFQSSYGHHAVPPPYTRTFKPPKPNLVFNNAPNGVETDHSAFTSTKLVKSPRPSVQHVETSIPAATPKPASLKPTSNGKRRNRKVCFMCKSLDHLIKDCDYHEKKMAQPTARNHAHMGNHKQYAHLTHQNPQKHMVPVAVLPQPKPVPITAVRPVGTFVPKIKVTRPRHTKLIITKSNSPIRRHTIQSPSPMTSNSPPRVTVVKAPVDKGVINSGYSRHMIGNMSYLSNCEELNGGYVAFGGNLKGDSLGKFNEKVDKEFLVGYSVSSKAFRVFNSRTRIVQETLLVNFLETKPNVACSGPTWLFDIDTLTRTINYQPVTTGNQSNPSAGFQDNFDAEKAGEESDQQYVLFPVWSSGFTNPQNTNGNAAFDENEPKFDEKKLESEVNVSPSSSAQSKKQDDKTKREAKGKSHVESFTGYRDLSAEFEDYSKDSINEVNAAELEDITYSDDEDDVGAETDFNNLETSITVSPIPTTRVHKDHHVTQIIGDLSLATQTMSMARVAKDQGGLSQMFNDGLHTCIFPCFLSQEEPKRVHQALKDPSWIEAIQEELLQFKMQKVWVLVDLPYGKRAIGTKWVFRNKKDEREVYVYQPPGFEDPNHPDKVYKVVKALYGLHQAPRAWYETLANYLLENDDIIFGSTNKDLCKSFEKLMKDKFQMSLMGEFTFFLGLQVKQKKDGIFISQDKYVAEILRKFRLTDTKSASTLIDTEKPSLKDPDGEDVDVHTYRSMIVSLMYLTSSRPDIMFAGKPHLVLWYPKDPPFDLVAFSDSDYAGASLDRKSTTRGCQFLRCRLISWQCKKQTVVATSSTEAEYVAAASCCVQWKSRIKRYIDTKTNHELIHYCLKNPPYKFTWADKEVTVTEAVQIILTRIDNDIYSTVDACPNACEMWKAIERLKQGESINVQDLETNLYWEFRKFTSWDGESLESYYSRFYKMMNELVRNQCDVTNHQVNVQFLLQLQPEWQRFVTLVKQSQELKTVSYHKLYDILKQHQNEVNELRAERLARTANPLVLVAQQQTVYHHQNHPTHYTQNSSTKSHQVATRNKGKAIINSPSPIYDQEPSMVAEDYEMPKDKEIDKLMALISLSFKKIYKPTNNNLRISSNTSRANQDNSSRINRAYHKEKMLLCKQEEAGFQMNAEQADWRDDTDDESKDLELEVANDDNYNMFSIESEHPEQSKSVNDAYPIEKDEHNVIIGSLDMSYDREQLDQDDDDLANERELLASLIEKLKREIDDSKNRDKFLETSNKVNDVTRLQALVDKKKVVITEATIRDALCLDDAEGVECLPNEEIFAELARISYEMPSTKLTFYKAFFSSQ